MFGWLSKWVVWFLGGKKEEEERKKRFPFHEIF